jgi:Xaa-Pro aminopeptidase
MFQTFSESADPTKGAERAASLRAKLKELSLDGFIVPRADEHQGEYVPKSAERLAWLTGLFRFGRNRCRAWGQGRHLR